MLTFYKKKINIRNFICSLFTGKEASRLSSATTKSRTSNCTEAYGSMDCKWSIESHNC